MIELPLVFLGGLLGSAHCVGMCGGFAVSIGMGSRGFAGNLRRQLVYTAGRIFTYSFFGVVAGYAGFWIAGRASLWINAQAVLCVIAGVLLTAQGLLALGVVPRDIWPKLVGGGGSVCLAGTFVGPFLIRLGRPTSWLPECSPAFSLAAWFTAIWLWRPARRTSGTGC